MCDLSGADCTLIAAVDWKASLIAPEHRGMFERQNVIAAVAVLVLFGVAAWLRPDPPPRFHAELGRVAAEERVLLNRYTAASADFKAGRIDDPAFADIVEREIQAPYADVQRGVEDLKAEWPIETERRGECKRKPSTGRKRHRASGFCLRLAC